MPRAPSGRWEICKVKILVCGARDWFNWKLLEGCLLAHPPGTHIIEGGAQGADTMARQFAIGRKWPYTEVPADWKLHGKAAGPIRNRVMLDMKPDLVIAFHTDPGLGKGTKDCVEEARRRGIPVDVIIDTEKLYSSELRKDGK